VRGASMALGSQRAPTGDGIQPAEEIGDVSSIRVACPTLRHLQAGNRKMLLNASILSAACW